MLGLWWRRKWVFLFRWRRWIRFVYFIFIFLFLVVFFLVLVLVLVRIFLLIFLFLVGFEPLPEL